MDDAPHSKLDAAIAALTDPQMQKWAQENKELYQKFMSVKDSDLWKKKDTSKDKLTISYTAKDEGKLMGKGEGPSPFAPDKVANYMAKFENRPIFDDMFDSGEIGDKIDDKENGVLFTLIYMKRKGLALVKSRDFVQASMRFKAGPDGETVYVISHSVESDKFPENKSSVRGHVEFMMYEIKPGEGGKGSYMTKMIRADPKGSIPGMIKDKILKKAGLEIDEIKRAMLS